MFESHSDRSRRFRATIFVADRFVISALVLSGLTVTAEAAREQEAVVSDTPAATLRVHLVCEPCDPEFVPASLGFADFDSDADGADVQALVTSTGGLDQQWRLALTGRGRFRGQDRVLSLSLSGLGGEAEIRREFVRVLKLGLVEYAVGTARGPELEVTVRRPPVQESRVVVNIDGPALDVTVRQFPSVPIPIKTTDRWNHWVFHLNLEADGAGEQSSFEQNHHVSAGASRTTEQWKVRVGASRSLSRSSFTVSDGSTVTSRLSDWSIDSLAVRSAGGHLAVALAAALASSTYSNETRVARAAAGIEYDIFPYEESTRRSLTIQYLVGPAQYDYAAETVFGKTSEQIIQHAAEASLGLRQPWGQVGGTFLFRQHLSALDQNRMTFLGNLSIRLTSHVALIASGSYARIRDQFTLPRGEATDEEVLLKLRQLATGHRYAASVGLSFSFGALSNATVNPRFTR